MAVLSPAERLTIAATFCEDISNRRIAFNLSKDDLRAAVNAIDQWIDDNAIAFNSAIPLPARTVLTAQQKVAIFFYVVRRRQAVT